MHMFAYTSVICVTASCRRESAGAALGNATQGGQRTPHTARAQHTPATLNELRHGHGSGVLHREEMPAAVIQPLVEADQQWDELQGPKLPRRTVDVLQELVRSARVAKAVDCTDKQVHRLRPWCDSTPHGV